VRGAASDLGDVGQGRAEFECGPGLHGAQGMEGGWVGGVVGGEVGGWWAGSICRR
jgi:hypothetical protein